MAKPPIIRRGTLSFSIESRILRELGERLVKQPEVAVLELVKNSYDADATVCTISYGTHDALTVSDDGLGMALERFEAAWMRIGTSSKESQSSSEKYHRLITGEKGIGRFAVRFLGRALHLESVAYDQKRKRKTRLVADFDWPKFDRHEDLGKVKVPYRLEGVANEIPTGTILSITRLRSEVEGLDLRKVRTGSLGVLSPLRSLFLQSGKPDQHARRRDDASDPGFQLLIQTDDEQGGKDVASAVLSSFVLRAQLTLEGKKVTLEVHRRGEVEPYLKIVDTFPNEIEKLYLDIRFFPRRTGTFTQMPVDGRLAQTG